MDVNSGNSVSSQASVLDSDTIVRIKYLAYVGTALYSAISSVSFDTNFFLAKEALVKFKVEIEKLKLDSESYEGMDKLIMFLGKELDKHQSKNRA